jgi:hypothetical protein
MSLKAPKTIALITMWLLLPGVLVAGGEGTTDEH